MGIPRYHPYPNRTPKQMCSLIYGSKLRFIRSLKAIASHTANLYAGLTPSEVEQIHAICDQAEKRAEEQHKVCKAEVDSRTETEYRQYTGK